MPRLGPGPGIGLPHIRASPPLAPSKPATILRSVDFPQPEAPSRQMNSPRSTVRLAPRRASMLRPLDTKVFETLRTSRIRIVGSAIPLIHAVHPRGVLIHGKGSRRGGGGRPA